MHKFSYSEVKRLIKIVWIVNNVIWQNELQRFIYVYNNNYIILSKFHYVSVVIHIPFKINREVYIIIIINYLSTNVVLNCNNVICTDGIR